MRSGVIAEVFGIIAGRRSLWRRIVIADVDYDSTKQVLAALEREGVRYVVWRGGDEPARARTVH